MSRPAAGGWARVRELFDRLHELSGEALGAVETGDEATLHRTLDERDRVAELITPLVGKPAVGDPERTRALEAARRVRTADARLEARLREARDRVKRELERAPSPHPGGERYLPPRPHGARLDVRL